MSQDPVEYHSVPVVCLGPIMHVYRCMHMATQAQTCTSDAPPPYTRSHSDIIQLWEWRSCLCVPLCWCLATGRWPMLFCLHSICPHFIPLVPHFISSGETQYKGGCGRAGRLGGLSYYKTNYTTGLTQTEREVSLRSIKTGDLSEKERAESQIELCCLMSIFLPLWLFLFRDRSFSRESTKPTFSFPRREKIPSMYSNRSHNLCRHSIKHLHFWDSDECNSMQTHNSVYSQKGSESDHENQSMYNFNLGGK